MEIVSRLCLAVLYLPMPFEVARNQHNWRVISCFSKVFAGCQLWRHAKEFFCMRKFVAFVDVNGMKQPLFYLLSPDRATKNFAFFGCRKAMRINIQATSTCVHTAYFQ